eukprot:CAMPEP_0118649546 /NCGR_PEP_ID=MMETSP0785-20121206/9762_1 /TAXON_ID=91992 /ORGANISM="Bolidomonas pacifica, Strain CCMP 1866" /LENGTH=873 /DNA_ID=CAMNT_0006541843 /DNA_START=337 /DNA_END=2958 /DNA_ORIENTATION=+
MDTNGKTIISPHLRRSMSSHQLAHPSSSSAMSMIKASNPATFTTVVGTPPSPICVYHATASSTMSAAAATPVDSNRDPQQDFDESKKKPSLLSQHFSNARKLKNNSAAPFLPLELEENYADNDDVGQSLGLPLSSPSSPPFQSNPGKRELMRGSPPNTMLETSSTTSSQRSISSNTRSSSLNALCALSQLQKQRTKNEQSSRSSSRSSLTNNKKKKKKRNKGSNLSISPPPESTPSSNSSSSCSSSSCSSSFSSERTASSAIPTKQTVVANKSRNIKRAAHAQAVIEDLIDSCTTLAVAESQSSDAATDGRKSIYNAIEKHLKSLPLRYALSIEHPSEVLLHMRLMNAARATKHTAAIHIVPIDPNNINNTFSTLHLSQTLESKDLDKLSLKRITVSGADASGLLEFITRVLSTKTSQVLDADVMLSSDSIALDRFLVNYEGRLRLDKLKGIIEDFLRSRETVPVLSNSPHIVPSPIPPSVPPPTPSDPKYVLPKPPSPPRSPSTRSAPGSNPLFVETDNNFLLDDDPITDADFQMSEPLGKVLDLPMDAMVDDEDATVRLQDLHVLEKIFSSQVSAIFKGIWRRSYGNGHTHHHHHKNKRVAIKAATRGKNASTKDLQELRREGEIAAPFKHENICRLLGEVALPHTHCLLYEFCSGGSLHSFLIDTDLPYECLSVALDIATGMAYLHSNDVIHRDLKSTNVLLDGNGRAKIADFGLSVFAPRSGQELTAETGTYKWMAPEVIRHESYSSNADVYSFGIVLWQLITRDVPFASLSPIQAAFMVAKEDRRPKIPSNTDDELARLVTMCWHGEQQSRPSFYYVVQILATMIRDNFNPFTVSLKTVMRAETALVNVQGNSTVNVDAGVSLVQDDA